MTACVLAKTTNLDRAAWLAARRQGVGGSDAAVVAGVSKWKSSVALWLEKTGQVEPEEPGESAYWGTVLEALVAEEFQSRTGLKVRRRNAILQHPVYKFMIANIDRMVVGKKAGLECKTTSVFNRDEWADDKVPDEYFIQCQHYMAVTGYQSWYIAVLIGGQKFVWKEIKRDDALIERLIEVEADFWRHVENCTMPAVDGSEASAQALRCLYPQSNGQIVTLPETAELWVKQYEKACADIKEAEARKDEAQNALCQMLGENEMGLVGDRKVYWKSTKAPERFDTTAFKVDHPELAAKYLKIGEPTRRFSIK